MSVPKAVPRAEFRREMALTMPAARRPSYRAEREFGLIVGVVLALLGGWWVFRGKFDLLAPALLTAGLLLVLLGAIFPRSLVLPNRAWMRLAAMLSMVSTPVILAIVFYFVVTPVGIFKRVLGWDPLRRRGTPEPSYWKPYSARQRDQKHYEKMY